MQASQATRDVTHKLALALKRGAGVQGNWGEQTLKNVLETAGLNNRYDFVEQLTVDDDHGKKLRPDVVVNIPGGVFVIDAKVNLSAFLESTEATDETHRIHCLNRHAQALQNHVNELSQKAYWDQFKGRSPDFVALFVPGDGLLSAALERDPALMSRAMDKKVIIVTPTTLFALCKAVAYGWRVEDQMHNAQKIADLGRELYTRMAVMGDHVGSMGRSLEQVVKKYNQFVGSLESRVLPKAREFETLSVDHQNKDIEPLDEIETLPKSSERIDALLGLMSDDRAQLEKLDL
jgi:DNA recombination protein RmuC